MLSIDPSEFRAAVRAKSIAAAFHLNDPLVSLIDVGFRIKEEEDKQLTQELVVRTHLVYKRRGAAFEAFSERYPEQVIDAERIGFPVDIIQADYRLQRRWWSSFQLSNRAYFYNPLQGGISISNEEDYYGFGTLGGKVRDRATGIDMILSAWHVLADSADAQPGLKIFQPGAGDGGSYRYTVALLSRHAMDKGIDAAVAKLTDTRRSILSEQLELGRVTGVKAPTLGMRVTKSGRASQVTEGIIDGVDGVTKIPYRRFNRTINHVVHITQTPERGEVSAPGDSGAFWLEKNTMKAVGLHFAGDNEPEYGLAIAMPQVLDALNVDIAL